MHVAIDLQANPPVVPRPLPSSGGRVVSLYYGLCVLLIAYSSYAAFQGFRLRSSRAGSDAQLAQAQSRLQALDKESAAQYRLAVVSGQLSDWLAITPPSQAITLLLTQDIDPNVSFSRLVVEMEEGQPAMMVTAELLTSSPDAGSRQAISIQRALEKAGFRTINVDTDAPTPEGWQFVAMFALPLKGDFSQITNQKP